MDQQLSSLAADVRYRLNAPLSIAGATVESIQAEPFPEEGAFLRNAAYRRHRTFRAGRNIARRALEGLSISHQPIPRCTSGAPLWPAGVVGSIAHTDAFAVAAVGAAAHFVGIGIDVESADPLAEQLLRSVLTTEELRTFRRFVGTGIGTAAKSAFCAKEAIYKCVHPITNEFLGFEDVEVEFGHDKTTFTATCNAELDSRPLIELGLGFISTSAVAIVTLFVLPST